MICILPPVPNPARPFCPLAASGALCISVEYLRVHSLHTKCSFLAREQNASCSASIKVMRKKLCFPCQRTESIARKVKESVPWT